MPIELFPLLKRLQVGEYDNCVILTYTADLYFFEQVVLPTLRSRGCYNNLVLMDSRQYGVTLDSMATMLQGLGKSYSVLPVSASNAFHPKVILQTNEKRGRLIIGSGNLTVRGFSSNWELFSEVDLSSVSATAGFAASVWTLVKDLGAGAGTSVRRQIKQFEETSGGLLSSDDTESWPRLLITSPTQPSLFKQLKELIGNVAVKRLIVVAPFFDTKLQAIKEFQKLFAPKEMIAVVQQATVSFPGKQAKAVDLLEVHEFAPPRKEKAAATYLHAKAYVLQTATAEYCVWGSPNCSMAAFAGSGNYEAALISKGKVGHSVAALGLDASLKKSSRIDPSSLGIAYQSPSPPKAALSIKSAEVIRKEITVVIANGQFTDIKTGQVRLWSQGVETEAVDVLQTDETTYIGTMKGGRGPGSMICRLVLRDENGKCESGPVAVHFLTDIAEATATRLKNQMQRVVDAIRSGTLDWADGLENVCELLIKIGSLERSAKPGLASRKSRALTESDDPDGDADDKVEEYDYFLGNAVSPDAKADNGQVTSILEDIVATLTAQTRQSTAGDSNDESTDDLDTWRYREEDEREAAESGETVSEQQVAGVEATEREHRRVRRAYIKLMDELSKRYAALCAHGKTMGTDESWRLAAVSLLLLNGCERRLEGANDCGPVITPEDIMHHYLPAVAIFLGRVRTLKSRGDGTGPLIEWVLENTSDNRATETARSACALLTGLVVHRQTQQTPLASEDDRDEWPDYTDIVAARCLALLLRHELLPTTDEIANTAKQSEWLCSTGIDKVRTVFEDLRRCACTIVRYEDYFGVQEAVPRSQDITAGDWVCAAFSGVTEVVRVIGKNVVVAMIGQGDTDEDCYREVLAQDLQRVHIPSRRGKDPMSVMDKLDYLLPYSDEDFESWQDEIVPQMRLAFMSALHKVSQQARSLRIRAEASNLLAIALQRTTHIR